MLVPYLQQKSDDDELDYTLDFSQWLESGDTITSASVRCEDVKPSHDGSLPQHSLPHVSHPGRGARAKSSSLRAVGYKRSMRRYTSIGLTECPRLRASKPLRANGAAVFARFDPIKRHTLIV
jgi:hypothetical protein